MDPVIAPTAYLFRMDCWKPETFPAKRFAEYVLKLAALFGGVLPANLHELIF